MHSCIVAKLQRRNCKTGSARPRGNPLQLCNYATVQLRRATLFVLVVVLALSPHCRRATGGDRDAAEGEAEDDLVGYLKIDTTNPPGNETAGAKYLQQLLQKDGIPSTLVGADAKRQSLYARLSSGTNEKALVLLHHIDVVPANPNEWTKPAFAGLREAGYIWGRGALDVK